MLNDRVMMTDRSRCFHHILVNILPNHTLTFAIPKEYSPSLSYVGGGSYGNVVRTEVQCKGANGSVCHSVAIKRFKNPFSDDRQARRLYREIKLLQLIRHDNLIRAFDLYSPDPRAEDLKEIYVVSIYAGTCLAQVLKNERKAGKRLLDMRQINAIIYQLLIAVKYLHSVKIIHRDLKPENLALRGDCTLTVLDFGLARSLDGHESQMTECVTTKRYRSPETIYWKVGNYSTPADLWSIGCIAGEIMQLSPIFTGDNETLLYTSIIEIVGSPSEQLLDKIERENDQELRKLLESFAHYHRRDFQKTYQQYGKEFADFLDKMLVLDPDERLTVEGALEHSYFEGWHVPEEEPLADWQFIEDKSLNEWKRIIWDEILNFSVEPFEEM